MAVQNNELYLSSTMLPDNLRRLFHAFSEMLPSLGYDYPVHDHWILRRGQSRD